jgi:hypothetical protein
MRTTWKHRGAEEESHTRFSNGSFGMDFRISNGRLKVKDEERIEMVTLGPEDQKGRKMGKTKSTRKHLL